MEREKLVTEADSQRKTSAVLLSELEKLKVLPPVAQH